MGTKLRFNAYAMAKLQYFKDKASTEISGFGITLPEDPLAVVDFKTILQECTGGSFEWDDDAYAQYFYEMSEAGLEPVNYARIWIHSHPCGCTPSTEDEKTFSKCFSNVCDWSVMAIFGSNNNESFVRLESSVRGLDIGISLKLTVELDPTIPFMASDIDAWKLELETNIQTKKTQAHTIYGGANLPSNRVLPSVNTENEPWKTEAKCRQCDAILPGKPYQAHIANKKLGIKKGDLVIWCKDCNKPVDFYYPIDITRDNSDMKQKVCALCASDVVAIGLSKLAFCHECKLNISWVTLGDYLDTTVPTS